MNRRAGLYGRISDHDDKVAKVPNQLKDCAVYAAQQGYDVVAEYADDGISASTGRVRPGFRQMIADIEAGKLDVVVAVDEDRLKRTLADTVDLHVVCADNQATWDTVRGGEVDPSNEDGEFFSTMRTAVARLEVRKKVRRQKAANQHRRQAGLPLTGTRPFGFEVDRVAHRPDEAKEIAWAYATVIATGKLYPVLKSWNARGVLTSRGNKWSYATLQQLLRRASNAGLVEHDGAILENVEAAWKGFVTRDEWQTVVAILSDPQRKIAASREPKHLLAGLVECGTCGSVMRSSGSTNKPGEKIYRCATKINAQGDGQRHASVRITDLDPIVRKAVIDSYFISSPEGMPTHNEHLADLAKLHGRLAEVRRGIHDLVDSIGQPGYTKARVDQAVLKLSTEEERLVAEVEEHSRRSAHAAMMVDTFTLMRSGASWDDASKHHEALAERFDSLSLEQKRTLIRALVKVTVYGGRNLADRVDIVHIGAPALDVEGDGIEGAA